MQFCDNETTQYSAVDGKTASVRPERLVDEPDISTNASDGHRAQTPVAEVRLRNLYTPSGPRDRESAEREQPTLKEMLLHAAVAKNVTWRARFNDLFHVLLTMTWPQLITGLFALYTIVSIIFAFLLYIGGDCVANATHFGDYLVFAIQTWTTIAYGYFHPITGWAHFVTTVFSMSSLLVAACVTGLVFSRISRPFAPINFSNCFIITKYNGRQSLVFRIANARTFARILDAHVNCMLARDETTAEGQSVRNYTQIKLMNPSQPMFSSVWQAVHDLEDPASPLRGIDQSSVANLFRHIVVVVSGYDADCAQTVHSSKFYFPEDAVFGHQFVDMTSNLADGRIELDHAKISKTYLPPSVRF